MENSEASKRAESENEPRYENLEVDVVDVDMVEVKPLIEIYTDLNETQKREALEKYRQRAILSRDARQTKREINTHNGKPCSGKACPGCTLCSEKAVYKNGKLEMSQLCKAKYEKYFSAEDERVYVHPDFYPSIKFEPKHNHCKKICCVCTRYPYLHGANKELVDSVHLKKNEPLSETCIKCKGVAHLTCATPSKKRFEYFICNQCHQVEFMRFQPYKEKLQEGWKWLLTTENLRVVYL